MGVENLHAEAREGVGNNIIGAWNVLGRYNKVVVSSKEKEATEEGHYVGTMGGARHQASDYCLIVAEHTDAKGAPPPLLQAQLGRAPSTGCFFPVGLVSSGR